jgi:DNA topoisomerase-1
MADTRAAPYPPCDEPPEAAAERARLRYVSDAEPGIARRKAGKGFSYRGPDGTLVRDKATLARIRGLAIPPAWTDVWISPFAAGHIQATGRDARGRKQYRYHPRWQTARDETKYHRLIAFARALPALRRRVAADLRRRDLPRDKVVAAVVRVMEETLIRIGNPEYARRNDSYGAVSLRDEHVEVQGRRIVFRFRGKGGKEHEVEHRDPRVAKVVQACQELPGQELFEYLDEEGEVHRIGSTEVNEYLQAAMGEDFTAKDLRTWTGTVLAAENLVARDPPASKRAEQREIKRAMTAVSERLGNTPAVCRKGYVHPAVIEGYARGDLGELHRGASRRLPGLDEAENAVLAFLERCAGTPAPAKAKWARADEAQR